jgi:hypothetical protein
MEAIRVGIGDKLIGQALPLSTQPRRRHCADAAQPCRARQPGMGPTPVVQFPYAGIGFAPALFDGAHQRMDGLPMQAVEAVELRRGRKKQQCLAVGVELELI